MALDQLLAALEREAAVTAERLLADARTRAATLEAEGRAAVERRREVEVTRAIAARRGALEAELARARHTGRATALAARERLLERVDRAVRRELPAALARPEYLAALGDQVAAGLAGLDEGPGLVAHCPPALVEALGAAIPAERGVAVRAVTDIGCGFRLATADGAVEVEDTLEGRYAERRGALARELLRDVEGPG